MVIEKFAALVPFLTVEGVHFELQLIIDGKADDIRLIYNLQGADQDSPHFASVMEWGAWISPFGDGNLEGFLFLEEKITTDEEFIAACERAAAFLTHHDLWDN